jgi:NADPH:quinone reductase-like Zn-dependent oxidoreductase
MFALVALYMGLAAVPPSMRAVHVEGHCKAPAFTCVSSTTIPTPVPGDGQILIRVGGSSLNQCDSDTVQGYPGCRLSPDGTPGGDVAGTVVQLGSGCTRLKLGDRVWANRFAIGGGMAEYALSKESQTGIIPTSLSYTQAGKNKLAFTECIALTGNGLPYPLFRYNPHRWWNLPPVPTLPPAFHQQ